jgi:prepilin-type N-terminal cleavage/methylation domain-containing protein
MFCQPNNKKDRVTLTVANIGCSIRHHETFGLTLTEVLVVVLVMGIMLAIAIPNYLASQNYAKQQACQANMAAIFQAEEAFRVRSRDYTTTLSTFSADMGGLPVCPHDTGAYTVSITGSGSTLALKITCPNTGKHSPGYANYMTTSDGVTFTNTTTVP